MYNFRYHVRVTHIGDNIGIADAYFGTINQVARFINVFDMHFVYLSITDDLFDKDIDADELLLIWRSN